MCAGAAEAEELAGLWRSLLVFVALFLLSVTYGASITLYKVGPPPAQGPGARAGDQPGADGPGLMHACPPPAGAVGPGRHPAGAAPSRPRLREPPGPRVAGRLGPEPLTTWPPPPPPPPERQRPLPWPRLTEQTHL